MDVRDLAPALQALEDLVQRSNELLNGTSSEVGLRVLADLRRARVQTAGLVLRTATFARSGNSNPELVHPAFIFAASRHAISWIILKEADPVCSVLAKSDGLHGCFLVGFREHLLDPPERLAGALFVFDQ